MKKILTGFCAVVFALMLNSAGAVVSINLLPSSSNVAVGDSFSISVEADFPANAYPTNIDSVSVQLNYDPSILRFDAVTLNGGAAFCDVIKRDVIANDGKIDIIALAHRINPRRKQDAMCPALTGAFTAFQIQMTALASGVSSVEITQPAPIDGVGESAYGWTSENNPGVAIKGVIAAPINITVDASSGTGISINASATYGVNKKTKTSVLDVEATVDGGANDFLEVDVNGVVYPMTWKSKQGGKWIFSKNDLVSNPGTVAITGSEGTVVVTVLDK